MTNITRVNNKIKDAFGDITNEYVMVGIKKVAANNPDLVRDCINPELYCHPKISYPIDCEFDDNGRLKANGKKIYTNNFDLAEYHLPTILCDVILEVPQPDIITKQYRSIPLELIPKEHFTECINDGVFYHNKYANEAPTKPIRYRQVDATKSLKHTNNIKNQLQYGIKSTTYTITEGKRYTFGAEIETSSGYLPTYLDKNLNYEAVHDGSLRDEQGNVNGGEYVTGVLIGDSGFLQLKRLCNELTKRCQVNHRCGVHVHIGGVNFNKEFIVHLYKLCQDIQRDLYAMLPASRRMNEYCRELKRFDFSNLVMVDNAMEYQIEIDSIYKAILHYVAHTDRLDLSRVNKKNQHPLGNKCGYNHNTARYCWLNLVPAMFNTRGNGAYTVEIRSHSATLSYTKIKNWILISMAIMWFAENEQEYIRNHKVKLEDVIKAAYAKKGDKLWEYVLERVAKFALDPNGQEKLDYQERELNNQLTLTTI